MIPESATHITTDSQPVSDKISACGCCTIDYETTIYWINEYGEEDGMTYNEQETICCKKHQRKYH